METKVKEKTKQTILGQFFPFSWAWKLVSEIWKIHKIFSKCFPPDLLSAV